MLGTTTRRITVGQPAPSDRAASASVCRSMATEPGVDAPGRRTAAPARRRRTSASARTHRGSTSPTGRRCAARPRSPAPGSSAAAGRGTRPCPQAHGSPQPHPDHRRHQQQQHHHHGENGQQQTAISDRSGTAPRRRHEVLPGRRVRPPAIRLRVEKSAIAYSGNRKNRPRRHPQRRAGTGPCRPVVIACRLISPATCAVRRSHQRAVGHHHDGDDDDHARAPAPSANVLTGRAPPRW